MSLPCLSAGRGVCLMVLFLACLQNGLRIYGVNYCRHGRELIWIRHFCRAKGKGVLQVAFQFVTLNATVLQQHQDH